MTKTTVLNKAILYEFGPKSYLCQRLNSAACILHICAYVYLSLLARLVRLLYFVTFAKLELNLA